MPPETITGDVITLKRLDPIYFKDYYAMFSPTVRKAIGILKKPTSAETKTFLSQRIQEVAQKKMLYYLIFDNKEKTLIGAIEIRDPSYPKGQLGTWINEQYWGKGRYQEALNLMLHAYFDWKENTDTVTAHIEKTNIRSLKAHKKYGFVITRTFEQDGKQLYELEIKKPNIK